MQIRSTTPETPLDVLIVGAGFAGLGAARYLQHQQQNHDNNCWIVEGRDYIGGRSRTITLDDGILKAELGSQWIQGAAPSNPVYKALLECSGKTNVDFELEDEDSSAAVYFTSSSTDEVHRLDDEEVRRLVEGLYGGPQGFSEYQANLQDEGDEDRSLRSIADDYIQERGLTRFETHALEWMLDSIIASEYAADLDDLSHWWWDDDKELEGGDIYLAKSKEMGFSKIIENYAEPVMDNISLKTKVKSVDWSNPTVAVKVQICPDLNEATIYAKHVLLTVPLGVLKAGSIDFKPNLPPVKTKAIESLGMGGLSKCVLL